MAIQKLNPIPKISYLEPTPITGLAIDAHIFSIFPDIEIIKRSAQTSPGSTVSQTPDFLFAAKIKNENIVITGQFPIFNKFYFAKVLVAQDVTSNDDVERALKSSTADGHVYKVTL